MTLPPDADSIVRGRGRSLGGNDQRTSRNVSEAVDTPMFPDPVPDFAW